MQPAPNETSNQQIFDQATAATTHSTQHGHQRRLHVSLSASEPLGCTHAQPSRIGFEQSRATDPLSATGLSEEAAEDDICSTNLIRHPSNALTTVLERSLPCSIGQCGLRHEVEQSRPESGLKDRGNGTVAVLPNGIPPNLEACNSFLHLQSFWWMRCRTCRRTSSRT